MKRFLSLLLVTVMVSLAAIAQKKEIVVLKSNLLPGPDTVMVAMPSNYLANNQLRLPVVYLLNGHGGDYRAWDRIIPLDELAERYGVIVVAPSGMNSWYFDAPANSKMQMESFIIEELVPYIDKNYRTLANRDSRAITGLSMGGHGALWLAIRNQGVFGNAGSTSGGVDFRQWPKSWNIKDQLGPKEKYPEIWDHHTVMEAAKSLKNGDLNMIIDCGTEDFFYKVNRQLHEQLRKQGVTHRYRTSRGTHNNDYWRKSIVPQMDYFKTVLQTK